MASIFDIFGEIDLKTGGFEGSISKVVSRLKNADSALDSTIARSNKLGDTSATVARRYEKLSEGIRAQRDRLLDNALAFEKGEINAAKFSSVVTSVDKATTGLSAKLKDAKARLIELDETGLTHFQQQISTAVDTATSKLELFRQKIIQTQSVPQSTDLLKNLFGNLSGQQKTQLSFQLNDIISGLAMGQNPLQILAQQGGQVVQVFQQGKKAQEGVAAATTAAATAQAAFAASAQTSAIAQASVATSSAATAASIQAASGQATILGASVGTLAAALSAGAIAGFAIYKVTQQIESVAKQRLALEEKITGEFNKQNILAAELNKLRGEAAEKRNFDQFLGGASPEALQKRLAEMTRQQQAAVAEAAELRRRQQTVGSLDSAFRDTSQGGIPIVGKIMPGDYAAKLVDDLAKQAEAAEAKARSFTDRILQLDRDVEVTRFAEQAKWDARNDAVKAANEAEKEADKKRKEMVKKAIEDAKKFAEHVKKAGEAVVGIFASTTDNPFVKIFTEGEQAVQRMLEATKGLGSELQNTLKKLIDSQTQSKAFKQSMDNALKATGLRSEAGTFLGKEKPTISQNLQKQLDAIGGGSPFISQTFAQDASGAFSRLIKNADPNQRARDQKIIELTRGMNPEDLTPTQRQQAAAARIREAEALEKEKPDALETQKQLVEVLKKLQEGKSLTIDVNDPTNSAIVKNATPQTVNLRFPNQ
jgi:hypothetical protein